MWQLIKNKSLAISFLFCGFVLGLIWDLPYRAALRNIYQEDYGRFVFNCDNAMREHFIAKSRAVSVADEGAINALQSAELGLNECHFYDKFRKRMLILGLSEDDLSLMGLEAIEKKRANLSVLVKEHEIRY